MRKHYSTRRESHTETSPSEMTLSKIVEYLPDMYVDSRRRRGFVFNILLIGDANIGKSTLLANLFNEKKLYVSREEGNGMEPAVTEEAAVSEVGEIIEEFTLDSVDDIGIGEEATTKLKIRQQQHQLQDKTATLNLNVYETDGFNETLTNKIHHSIDPIVDFVKSKLYDYFTQDSCLKRDPAASDPRIHCCIYLIPSVYSPVRAIDLAALKQLQHLVPIVPVVARSDALTHDEKLNFKSRFQNEIEANGLELYTNSPFFTVCDLNNKRSYAWGMSNVMDHTHSDLKKLRTYILEEEMLNLIDHCNEKCYHDYRQKILIAAGYLETTLENTEFLRDEFEVQKDEMRTIFVQRVKDSESELEAENRSLQAKTAKLEHKILEAKNTLNEHLRQQAEFEQQYFDRQKELEEFMRVKKLGAPQYSLKREGDIGSGHHLNYI